MNNYICIYSEGYPAPSLVLIVRPPEKACLSVPSLSKATGYYFFPSLDPYLPLGTPLPPVPSSTPAIPWQAPLLLGTYFYGYYFYVSTYISLAEATGYYLPLGTPLYPCHPLAGATTTCYFFLCLLFLCFYLY